MQLILFSLYLQGIFMVPSCLIIELPYAERTASFFSSVSGLGFPLLLNFSEGIMQSSLIGKTLLCVPVSTLLWGLIFCFLSGWVISECYMLHHMYCVSSVVCLPWHWPWWYWLSGFHHHRCRPVLDVWITSLKTGFVLWLNCFHLLVQQTDCQWLALPHFSTWRTVSWTFVPWVLFSAVVTEFPFFSCMNGINTPVLLIACTTSC